LSRLSVGSVSFFLDLVRRLGVSRFMISFSECNFRAALVIQFLAVKDLSRCVHVSAYLESTLLVWQIMSLYLLSIFIGFVIMVESFKHLSSLSCSENFGSVIETRLIEHIWIVSIKVLSISKGVLLGTDT
jgi:hypothetical protein